MHKREIIVAIFMVLLFLVPVYIITLPFTWIFQIEMIDKIQSLLPKPCFYIEDSLGASLKDGETGQVIDDNLKASLTKNDVIYAIGHYGFYVADTKNKTIKIFSMDRREAAYYQKNHYIRTGKNNAQILADCNLSTEEKEIRQKLQEAISTPNQSLFSDIDVYMWKR